VTTCRIYTMPPHSLMNHMFAHFATHANCCRPTLSHVRWRAVRKRVAHCQALLSSTCGVPPRPLRRYSIEQLRQAGVMKMLKEANFALRDLVAAGYSLSQLRKVGCACSIEACFPSAIAHALHTPLSVADLADPLTSADATE
jgi:hypothetical protein